MVGLESIMDVADKSVGANEVVDDMYLKIALNSEGVNALAKTLLLDLAPYNYVVCRNCQKKQDLRGTSCYNCGNRLLVDVEVNRRNIFIPTKAARAKQQQDQQRPLSGQGQHQRPVSGGLTRSKMVGFKSSSSTNSLPLKQIKGQQRNAGAQRLSHTAPLAPIVAKETSSNSESDH